MEPAFADSIGSHNGTGELKRSYEYAGEEDRHGDSHRLIERASVIEPVAAMLRVLVEQQQQQQQRHVDIAILSARAHDPRWLAPILESKLQLRHGALPPSMIKTVYSRDFEATLPESCWSTPARKAHALGQLLQASAASECHIFDDVLANLEAMKAHATFCNATGSLGLPPEKIITHLVPYDLSVSACAGNGIDIRDLLHPSCRHDGAAALSPLLERLLLSPVAEQRLGMFARQPQPEPTAAAPNSRELYLPP
jgi:hypothetical protein